jgi:hypothetical protein
MIFGSTSKNIGLLTIFLFIGSIVGLFFVDYCVLIIFIQIPNEKQ